MRLQRAKRSAEVAVNPPKKRTATHLVRHRTYLSPYKQPQEALKQPWTNHGMGFWKWIRSFWIRQNSFWNRPNSFWIPRSSCFWILGNSLWIRQNSFWIWPNSFIRRLQFPNPTSSFWIRCRVSESDFNHAGIIPLSSWLVTAWDFNPFINGIIPLSGLTNQGYSVLLIMHCRYSLDLSDYCRQRQDAKDLWDLFVKLLLLVDAWNTCQKSFGGFHKSGYPNSRMFYKGKSI